jgi:MYXO-CTERM domain-containing protein
MIGAHLSAGEAALGAVPATLVALVGVVLLQRRRK